MHLPTPAGPRRRTRRALLAATLPAVLAAVALPSVADAATAGIVTTLPGADVLEYSAAPGETNHVYIRVNPVSDKLVISDTAPITARNGCSVNTAGDAECPIGADFVNIKLGDGDDRIEYATSHAGGVNGDSGSDLFIGAIRPALPFGNVSYHGGAGVDTVSYRFASRGVRVNLHNSHPITFDDGRPGDREGIDTDVEVIEGSNFNDTLTGSDRGESFRGLEGSDTILAGGGDDFIDEGTFFFGFDTIDGGAGTGDRVSYRNRTIGVNVSLDDQRNDGTPDIEDDNVRSSVEHIWGSDFGDTLTGSGSANTIDGFGGLDTVSGLGGNDTLSAGARNNFVGGGTGNDVIEARNGSIDNIDCGENPNDSDTANRDTNENSVVDCERGAVGVLRLTPASLRAKAGETARLKLSWRHPKGWKQLKKIELRLTRDGITTGELTIRPGRDRIADDGAIRVKRSRIATRGKTVIAHLALRLDESLAGQTLKAEVEATEAGGRRQLERDAGTVRVAR